MYMYCRVYVCIVSVFIRCMHYIIYLFTCSIGNSGAVDWISSTTFRRVLEVNLFGVVNVTKAFLPLLKKTRGARIVNLSSVAGFLPAPMMAAYDASKHGVEGYAKALRLEMKPWNIHVSNVNPGFMK